MNKIMDGHERSLNREKIKSMSEWETYLSCWPRSICKEPEFYHSRRAQGHCISATEDSGDYQLRSKCLRNPNTVLRQVYVFYGKRPGSITDEMKQKIDTPESHRTYSKRLGIIEPACLSFGRQVFGNIRTCKKMDRFTLRGKVKVKIQWMLYCLVHNAELPGISSL